MAGGLDLGSAAGRAATRALAYVGRLLRGDLGLTTAGSDTVLPRAVGEVILERLPRSLGLLGVSLLLASALGIGLGILAARGRGQRSLVILLSTLAGVSVPSFFAAFLLQWAAITYTRQVGRAVLPVGGFGWDRHLVLPALVLAARPVAQITRIAFVSVRRALAQDYVRTAQSKGLRRSRVMAVHVMRNAAIPILTTVGVSLRYSLSSLPVVELYFGWTGVGFALLKGIAQRDDNLTVALVLCLGTLFILVNLVLELCYRLIDPRLRQAPAHVTSGERASLREVVGSARDALLDLVTHSAAANWLRRRHAQKPLAPIRAPQAGDDAQRIAVKTRQRSVAAALRNPPLLVGSVLVLGLVMVIAFGPQLSPNNPAHTQGLIHVDGEFTAPPFAPNETYPWGTDALGRGLMSLVLSGARQTLMLATLAVAARTLVGVVLGAVAGWTNGSTLDRLILALAEVVASFPTLLLSMIFILALGIRRGMAPFIIALCLSGWGEIMQFVRGQVTAIRPRPYVESALAVGARTPRILARHVMPHLFSALISIVALEMGSVLMLLGELGFVSIFIGGGTLIAQANGKLILHSDVPEWGALLSNLRYMARSYPWTALYPMSAFFISILSLNLFSEGVRRLIESGNLIVNRIANRYTLTLSIVAVIGLRWLSANSGAMPFYRQQASAFDGERALDHVAALTAPAMEGHALGSTGLDRAAQYVAEQFEQAGLQSGGQEGTYFQERKRAFERLTSVPTFTLEDGGAAPIHGQDYAALASPYLAHGEARGPVRFVCLGEQLATQSAGWRLSYADVERADFAGEIVLTLSGREADVLNRVRKDGLLVVVEDPALLAQRATIGGRTRSGDYPRLQVSDAMAERLLRGSGHTLSDLRETCHELPAEQALAIPLSTQASMSVTGELEDRWPVRNVIGYIPGSHSFDNCYDCLGRQLIVVLAQYDSPPAGPDGTVYPAANDNASGVAVMLEALRVIQETGYQPYKSFLFVAYSGEGLEGGEYVYDPDVTRFLKARAALSRLELEAIVRLRGVGAGTGRRLEISSQGSLRLAELLERAARHVGVRTVRADESIDIGVIYGGQQTGATGVQDAPMVDLFWQGWKDSSRLPKDTLVQVSAERMEKTGRTLALSLMILGREREY